MDVSAKCEIKAAAGTVWDTVKHFDGLTRWAAGVVECTATGAGVGAVRTVTLREGMTLREKLETFDEAARTFSYSIVDGPLPFKNYLGRVSVADNGDDCVVTWAVSAEPAGIPDEQLEKILGGVCHGSVKALKSHCELQPTGQMRKYEP